MKKLLALVCASAVGALLVGCFGTDPVSAPRVSIDAIGSIGNGSYKNVTGKIDADTAISSIDCKILTSADAVVPASQISVTWPSPAADAKTLDFTATNPIKITVLNAPAADYKLKISVTAGASTDVTFPFTVTGSAGTPVTTAEVTLGSYDNATVGSSVDFDAATPVAILAEAAKKANSGVDLVGTYSPKYTALRIFNPVYAKNESNVDAFKDWVDPAATSFVKITQEQFNGVATAEQIKPLYDAGTSITSASTAVNECFVVKTDQNKYVAIKIKEVTPDVKSTWSIKTAK